ncbi:MAG: RNHCP domain-containing protein [Bacilli bacterium]|nr:RNHCP domain-containing protein [Mycoplasmatota bacterium]MDY4236973.1 RNHCP domain-containing protein [Bacilli bacterium]
MDVKMFKRNDDSFICDVCNANVPKLLYSSRDHCNNCLCSKHVDINPGDRLSTCLGTLRPIGVEKTKKDMFKIIYKCDKCGEIKKNIQAMDDNMDEIIRVSTNGGNL